jgi:biotin transport system substrate-specific component
MIRAHRDPSPGRTMTARDHAPPRSLVDRLWPAGAAVPAPLRHVVLAVLGTLLLTLSAKLKVPFYPVPMTMQPAVLLLLGVAYGPRLGVATVLLYLAEGALGLTVFAGTPERGIGLAYMAGPTGGYLASFPLMTLVAGLAAERARGWLGLGLGLLLAVAVNYALGVAWLAGFVGLEKAVAVGVLPFLLGDLLKLLLVTALAAAGLSRLRPS